jgi:hypothetical protein
MSDAVPLMPDMSDLPEAVRKLRDERWRRFTWGYVFGGGEGAAAARFAGYSDVKEACKVRAHGLLQRDDIQAAIKALTGKYLFSLAPKAILRLGEILDNPKHAKHTKAIEMVLDRTGHGAQTDVNVNVSGELTVNHTDQALSDLRALLELGVAREKLIEVFGFSGLSRYEKMLAEADARTPKLIEGEVLSRG